MSNMESNEEVRVHALYAALRYYSPASVKSLIKTAYQLEQYIRMGASIEDLR